MSAPLEEPPHLRTLRRLVNTLTVVLILGFITVVVVIVIRFASPASTPSSGPELPAFTSLPGSEAAQAVTYGKDWIAIVTVDEDGNERIRTYGLDGLPRQTIDIEHYE